MVYVKLYKLGSVMKLQRGLVPEAEDEGREKRRRKEEESEQTKEEELEDGECGRY